MRNQKLSFYLVERYNLSEKACNDYFFYLDQRDYASELRIQGLEHTHPYFKSHPSCQNRRYMDRESQYFIQDRLSYEGNYPITDAFFHLIFRKASTYRTVRDILGDYPGNLLGKHELKPVLEALQTIEIPFTGAYLVPHRAREFATKVEGWLDLFSWHKGNFEVLQKYGEARTAYTVFRNIRGIGDFLAMQFSTEIGWLDCTKYSGNEWVVPGNGAVRGLQKLGLNKYEFNSFLFELVVYQPNKHKNWLPMTLMDFQNTFCEFDKFTRYLGGYDNQGREKMKRLRKPHATPITEFVTTEKLSSTNYHRLTKLVP
jgi:alpha-glutamyl/putrescinyl thymine pyrophosphorylase clade 1